MSDIELVIKIPEKTVNDIKDNAMFAGSISSDIRWDITNAIVNGTPLEQEPFDEIIDKTVKEIYVQCKQTNSNFSKDWNEGFNDGMFHTITIIKGIRKRRNTIKR